MKHRDWHHQRMTEMLESRKGILKLAKRSDLSPLRYPGGKRKLIPVVSDIFCRSHAKIKLLVEPFAGGAAISVSHLESGLAEEIAISDKDELVAAFWKTVFSKKARELADLILTANVTLKVWDSIKKEDPQDEVGKAFKCLFLNRTSFSGILHTAAGPIGGREQKSQYPIGCRYNAEALAKRVLELSALRSRVRFVRCQSYQKTISDIRRTNLYKQEPSSIFWYLDPPFFDKADKLYRYCFDEKGHEQLKYELNNPAFPGQWVLSYDDVEAARKMYSEHPGFCRVNLSYNARIDKQERLTASEIIVSNIIASLRQSNCESVPKMGKVIPIGGFNQDILKVKQKPVTKRAKIS